MYGDTPIKPAFDDEALEYVLYGTGLGDPTPADVLEAWRRRDDLPEDWRKAAVAILLKDPNKGRSLSAATLSLIVGQEMQAMAADEITSPRALLHLARLCHAAQHSEEAEAGYRQALARGVGPAALSQDERWQAMGHLAELLDHGGRAAEAREMQILCEAERIFTDTAAGDLVTVRSLALKLFLDGRYETSEQLYRGLLERRFQQAGTWVHLARVLLIQGRLGEARQAVASAYRHSRRPTAPEVIPPYVWPRILFLRLVFAMLGGRPRGHLATALKRALDANPIQEPWTLGSLFDRILPILPSADGELLTAFAEAINDADKLRAIEALPIAKVAEGNPQDECSDSLNGGGQ